MSVDRSVIADANDVPESRVRCENCGYNRKFINDVYLCNFWDSVGILAKDAFCSFWRDKEERSEE